MTTIATRNLDKILDGDTTFYSSLGTNELFDINKLALERRDIPSAQLRSIFEFIMKGNFGRDIGTLQNL